MYIIKTPTDKQYCIRSEDIHGEHILNGRKLMMSAADPFFTCPSRTFMVDMNVKIYVGLCTYRTIVRGFLAGQK